MTLDELDAAYAAMTSGVWEQGVECGDHEDYNVECNGEILLCGFQSTDEVEGVIALHNHYPAVRGLLRRAVGLLRPFAIHRDCHEIRTFLAECEKPLTETTGNG